MNSYELLEAESFEDGIAVIDYEFDSDRIKGLYCDGVIAINKNISTTAEKACVLAEELGHHYTSCGDIIDLSIISNRKQERQARLWAYNKKIGLHGLIRAAEYGCRNAYEIAEFLDVTEDFLRDAVHCYQEKFGIYATVDNYIIYFVPNLIVGTKL